MNVRSRYMHAATMAHLCPHRRVLQQSIRPGACLHKQPVYRHSARCRATIELPPVLQAVVDEVEESKYCGGEGGPPASNCRLHALFAHLIEDTAL